MIFANYSVIILQNNIFLIDFYSNLLLFFITNSAVWHIEAGILR